MSKTSSCFGRFLVALLFLGFLCLTLPKRVAAEPALPAVLALGSDVGSSWWRERAHSSRRLLQVSQCQAALNPLYAALENNAVALEDGIQSSNTAVIQEQCTEVEPELKTQFQSLQASSCSNPTPSDQTVINTVVNLFNAYAATCAEEGYNTGGGGGGGALSADGSFVSWGATNCAEFADCFMMKVWVTLAVLGILLGLSTHGGLMWRANQQAKQIAAVTDGQWPKTLLELFYSTPFVQTNSWLGSWGRSFEANGYSLIVSSVAYVVLVPTFLVAGVAQPYDLGWALAAAIKVLCGVWLKGASTQLQLSSEHPRAAKALKALVVVLGVSASLSCLAGLYALIFAAICTSTTQVGSVTGILNILCSGDPATRSVNGVYIIQVICFTCDIVGIVVIVGTTHYMYYINQLAAIRHPGASTTMPAAAEERLPQEGVQLHIQTVPPQAKSTCDYGETSHIR